MLDPTLIRTVNLTSPFMKNHQSWLSMLVPKELKFKLNHQNFKL